jgi:hypothetical protein
VAYASRSGRARTSAKNPQAFAVCDRCGIWYNRVDLQWQFEWRGAALQNLFIAVCKRCLDVPQEQNRAITLPADPVPIFMPRVESFADNETDYRTVSAPPVIDPATGLPLPSKTLRVTEDCKNRTVEPFGIPSGEIQAAVMPYGVNNTQYGDVLQILSVTSDGSSTVTVTCSAVHNLQTNDQVSVEGLNFGPACGMYSVVVTTATAFTYMTYGSNPSDSLLTSTTRIITCLIGLPLGFTP